LLLDHAAAQLDTRALLFINEMQRHIDLNGLVHTYAQKISVHGKAFGWMPLDVLNDRVLRLTVHLNF
jgi:hypothetical protein